MQRPARLTAERLAGGQAIKSCFALRGPTVAHRPRKKPAHRGLEITKGSVKGGRRTPRVPQHHVDTAWHRDFDHVPFPMQNSACLEASSPGGEAPRREEVSPLAQVPTRRLDARLPAGGPESKPQPPPEAGKRPRQENPSPGQKHEADHSCK